MTDDDAELVALIDNELDENRKSALLARLETDERLRERYEAFERRERRSPPHSTRCSNGRRWRLRAAARTAARRRTGTVRGHRPARIAAGFVIGLLVAGAAAGRR